MRSMKLTIYIYNYIDTICHCVQCTCVHDTSGLTSVHLPAFSKRPVACGVGEEIDTFSWRGSAVGRIGPG